MKPTPSLTPEHESDTWTPTQIPEQIQKLTQHPSEPWEHILEFHPDPWPGPRGIEACEAGWMQGVWNLWWGFTPLDAPWQGSLYVGVNPWCLPSGKIQLLGLCRGCFRWEALLLQMTCMSTSVVIHPWCHRGDCDNCFLETGCMVGHHFHWLGPGASVVHVDLWAVGSDGPGSIRESGTQIKVPYLCLGYHDS